MADPPRPAQGKITQGELKQQYAHLVEKTKQQKTKIDQYAENQQTLQAAIAERDLAIQSRDSFIEECKRTNEESVSRLQSKDFQLAALFNRVNELELQLKSEQANTEALKKEINSVPATSDPTALNQMIAVLNSEKASLLKQIEELESKSFDLSAPPSESLQIASLSEENRRLKAEVARLESECLLFQHSVETPDVASLNDEIASWKAVISELRADQGNRIEKEKRLLEKLGSDDQQLDDDAKSNRLFELESQLRLAKQAEEEHLQQQSELQSKLSKALERTGKVEAVIEALKSEVVAVKSESAAQNQILKDEMAKRDGVIGQLQEKFKQKQAEVSGLKKEHQLAVDNLTQQLTKSADEHTKGLEKLVRQIETEKADLRSDHQIQLERVTRENTSSNDDHAKALQRLRSQFDSEKGLLEKQLAETEARLRTVLHQNDRSSQVADAMQRLSAEHERLKGAHALSVQNLGAVQEVKSELETRVRSLTATNESLESHVAALSFENGTITARLSDLRAELSGLQVKFATSELLSRSVTEDRDRLATRHENQKAKHHEQRQLAQTLQKELTELRPQLQRVRSDLQNSATAAIRLQSELDSFKRKAREDVVALENKVADLQAFNEDLERQVKLVESEVVTWKTLAERTEREMTAKLAVATEAANANSDLIARLTKQKQKSEVRRHELGKQLTQLQAQKTELERTCESLQKQISGRTGASTTAVFPTYIRKVLLQFFLQDGSTREALVPVILNLVECDDKLIQQAKRSWAESTQIISHPFSLFGF
jgi:chromosome segregation ATPase